MINTLPAKQLLRTNFILGRLRTVHPKVKGYIATPEEKLAIELLADEEGYLYTDVQKFW